VTGILIAALFAALEYVVASLIGLSELIGGIAAIQVGILAAVLIWLGGIPVSVRGL
jgi:hypothetical protein